MRGRKLRIGETSVRLYARHTKPVPKKRTTAAQLGAEYRENRKYHRSLHTSPDDAWLEQCLLRTVGENTASVGTKFSTRGNVDVEIDLHRCMIVPESGRRALKPARVPQVTPVLYNLAAIN